MDELQIDLLLRHFCHDMRNSIGSNTKLLQLFESLYASQLDDKANKWLGLLQSELASASIRLDAVSNFARLYSAKVDKVTFALSEWVEGNAKVLSTQVNIINAIPQSVDILADKALLEIIMRELVENAKVHAKPVAGEHLLLKLSIEQDDTFSIISFSDNGKAVNKDKLDTMLKPLKGINTSATHPGIGLNIVQLAAVKMGGSIDLQCTEQGALQVNLRLPRD